MIEGLYSLKTFVAEEQMEYEKRIKKQWLSPYRAGVKKNLLIQQGLNAVRKLMDDGDINKAHETIVGIKSNLELKFGRTNFFGDESEAFKMIDQIEKRLMDVISREKLDDESPILSPK